MSLHFKFYKVGGCVRDSLLGHEPKDIDYVCVAENSSRTVLPLASEAFAEMKEVLLQKGYKIFLETPACLTIRAKSPSSNEVADFVLARREKYSPASRKPETFAGSLYDDAKRRDFTINAMALDANDGLIDFFNGAKDLKDKILKTPAEASITFNEDPLRLLRAMRFSVTKGFKLSEEVEQAILNFDYSRLQLVSQERIREELEKMFSVNSLKSIQILSRFEGVMEYVFEATELWLKPTLAKIK